MMKSTLLIVLRGRPNIAMGNPGLKECFVSKTPIEIEGNGATYGYE